jgi:hypothetical protein
MLLVAAVLLAQLPVVWSDASYLGLLDGLCGLAALAAGARLWRHGLLECRLVALLVVGLALAGQLVAVTVGLPGASALAGFGPWHALGIAVDVTAVTLLSREIARMTRV